jgi:uncharacterized protein involved in response to NO
MLVDGEAGDLSLWESLLVSKAFYVGLLFIVLLPNVIKKNVKELKIASYLLLLGVVSMLGIFVVKSLNVKGQ